MSIFDFLRGGSPEDRFARRVMARLRERGWPDEMRYDPKTFAVALGDRAGTMSLGNIFQEWSTYPHAEQAAALDQAINYVFELDEDQSYEAVVDLLLPVIRNRSYLANSASNETDGGDVVAHKNLGGSLAILVAVDRPASMQIANSGRFKEWNRSFDEVLARAVENLKALSPCRFERAAPGFFISDYGDYYDASRLLLPHLFQQLELRGDPVAVAVSRTCLVVAGSDDVTALEGMAAFVKAEARAQVRPISHAAVIWRGGEWSPFEPEDRALPGIRALAAEQRLWDYSDQLTALEEDLAGQDVFVAPLEGLWDGDELRTWSSWAEGVTTMLPQADVLSLSRSDGETLVRRRDDIEAVCGSFQQEDELYPRRYLTGKWPTPDEWRRLQSEYESPGWFAS